MKTLKLKKLIVSVTLLIAAGVFFFASEACAITFNPNHADFVLRTGTQGTLSVNVYGIKTYTVWVWSADEQNIPNWLKVNDHFGYNPDYYYDYFLIMPETHNHVIDVEVNAAGLAPGEYSHNIPWWYEHWSSDYKDYGPVYIYVDLIVCGSPSLSVSPSSLNFGSATDSLNLTVKNSEYGDQLNWWVGLKPSWVSVNPANGSLGPPGGSQTVTATVNRGGLNPGTYTDTIIFSSDGGSQSVSVSMTVPDTIPPTGTISINSGAVYTGSTSVTLTLSASDVHSEVSKMRFSNDGVSWSGEENYATSKSWMLTAGDGLKTVYVQYKDSAGNRSSSISDTITLDRTPPSGTISINNGAGYTNSTSVTLTLSASDSGSGVSKMKFSNDGVVFSSEENYATSKFWMLTASDGTKTVYVQYKDNAGNWSASISDTIVLDTTPPTGTISINSGDGYAVSTSVTLTLLASDSSGVSKMQFSDDGVVFSSEEDYATSKSWTLTTGDGEKNVYVRYKDNSGIWSGPIGDTIILDTTAPTGTISINNGDGYTGSTSVTLTLSASDSGSGVSKVRFSNDGVSWSGEENYATSKSWTLTAGEGTKTVYVQYKDNAGNWSGSISDTIILDTTSPTGTISINSGDIYANSTSVTLTLSASDSNGVSKMRFSNDGVVWSGEEDYATSKSWTLTAGDGTKVVYVQYKDNAGNWGSLISDTIILDTTPPSGTILINDGDESTDSTSVTLTLSASDSGSGVSKMQFSNDGVVFSSEEDYATSKSWTLTDGDGTKTVYVQYKDNAGNWSGLISNTIVLDTNPDPTPPSGTISINGGAVYTNTTSVTLTLSASDSSGVSKMQFSNDGVSFSSEEDYATSRSWTLTAGDGLKTVYVRYMDSVGNWNDPPGISDTIILDTTPPTGTISINSGAVYTNSTSVTLTLSASDSSGVSKMQFSSNGVDWGVEEDTATSKSWTLTASDGLKSVYVRYKDNAGNWSGLTSISDTIILDTTPPTGTISINSGAGYTNSTSVTLTLSASDSNGVSKMQFSNDGVSWSSEEDYATSKDWMLTDGEGTKTVYVQYKDNAGHWSGSISDTIILETTPPTGTILINDGDEYTDSTSVTLTLSASDSSGVSKMKFSDDGVSWSSEEDYATSKSWTLTAGDGIKTVYVQYKDNAGNSSAFISDTIILETEVPTGTILINDGDGYTNSTSVTLTLSASDAGSGISKMRFSNDGVSWSSEEDYAPSKSWTVIAGDGEKIVYVQYKDNAGNWSVSISDTIILDTISPTGTILINDGDGYTNSTSITLTLLASDSSGVGKMRFSNDGVSWSGEENYATSKSWTLAPDDGTKTVYVQYRDNAGNWSASINDTIILDTQNPTVTLVVDNDKSTILPDGEIVGVLPDTGMEAKFSKVMDTESVKGLKLIAVKDNLNETISEEVSLNFAWDSSTKTVITPVSELKKNYLYSLKVTDTVTDLAGNTVESEREIIFRTIMDHTKKNVIVKATDEKLIITATTVTATTVTATTVTVTLEANALKEDGYLIINTEPLTYQFKVDPEDINVANEKSITNGWYPIEGCLWEIKVCKENGDWMEDKFGSEVKITFPYDEDNGVVKNAPIPLMEETLLAFWLNEEHSNWVRVPGSRVDRENNVIVTGEVPHFSVFGLMGSAVYDLSDAHAYPVPWKPNDGKDGTGNEQQGITFTNLSAEGAIKIYTISGELVREYDYKPADGGKWTWDVNTSRGEKVFSGVYIYYIKNEKEQKTGRLIIIR